LLTFRYLWVFSIFLLSQCNTVEEVKSFFINPDVKPIKETLSQALPIAYAAKVAQLTVEGNKPGFVEVVSSCNSFPCTSVIRFKVGDTDFPWFEGPDNTTVTVAGLWTSPEQGLLSLLFTSNFPGSIRLLEFKTFPVEQFGPNLLIAFSRLDINAGDSPLLSIDVSQSEFDVEFDRFVNVSTLDSLIKLDEEVWMIEVADQNTVDLSDDSYILTGAGQFVTVADQEVIALQVAMLNVEMSSSCITNPLSGDILINNAGTNGNTVNVGMAQLQFEGNCDAKVRVNIATGSYIASFGKNLDFDLTAND